MSKTATWGTSGNAFWAARMPCKLAGLWSGARSKASRMASTTSPSMSADSANRSPPWTTRWPTAPISGSTSPRGPSASRIRSSRCASAVAWSGAASEIRSGLASPRRNDASDDTAPMRSTWPAASTAPASASMRSTLSDDEPALTTRTVTGQRGVRNAERRMGRPGMGRPARIKTLRLRAQVRPHTISARPRWRTAVRQHGDRVLSPPVPRAHGPPAGRGVGEPPQRGATPTRWWPAASRTRRRPRG